MQGLRVPNSYLDLNFPGGILNERYFRGGGTSQSAVVTSGAVALILQRYPAMSPDQVKAFLADNANSLSVTPRLQGNGEIDLHMLTDAPPNTFAQWAASSLGNGSLELSRGSDHVTDDGVILAGEQDIFGHPFNSVEMALEAAAIVVGRRLEWQQLERQQLVQLVVRQQLERQQLERQQLVRELVVRQQLVRELVVRQQLVRNSWSGNSWSTGGWY